MLEIKCPWTDWLLTIPSLTTKKSHLICSKISSGKRIAKFADTDIQIDCTEIVEIGSVHGVTLDVNHPYYVQVQCQMFCTGRQYCDLVTYTLSLTDNVSVCIKKNELYIDAVITKARHFGSQVLFQNCT